LVGPNGAGKSTFYQRFLSGVKWPFVNADVLAKSLVDAGSPAGEETEILAAKLAEKRRGQLIEKRESFIAETVFSDPVGAKVRMLKEARLCPATRRP
jgi:predicted ABC-type ATPase